MTWLDRSSTTTGTAQARPGAIRRTYPRQSDGRTTANVATAAAATSRTAIDRGQLPAANPLPMAANGRFRSAPRPWLAIGASDGTDAQKPWAAHCEPNPTTAAATRATPSRSPHARRSAMRIVATAAAEATIAPAVRGQLPAANTFPM